MSAGRVSDVRRSRGSGGMAIAARNRGGRHAGACVLVLLGADADEPHAAMPSSAPGIDSSAVSRSVSFCPGIVPRWMISPKSTEPTTDADERADDARPPAVGQEDREVPERDRDHDPDEHAHQRGLPCLRLRGFLGLGGSPARRRCRRRPGRSPPAGGAGGVSPRGAGAAAAGGPVAPRGRGGGLAPAGLLDAEVGDHVVELRPARRPATDPAGVVTPRRRRSAGATSTGPPCSAVA